MFDTETIIYGVLVLCSIIACIITFYPRKQKLTFPEWIEEVDKVFHKQGFSAAYTQSLNKRDWEGYYTDGLSPRQAVEEYLHI